MFEGYKGKLIVKIADSGYKPTTMQFLRLFFILLLSGFSDHENMALFIAMLSRVSVERNLQFANHGIDISYSEMLFLEIVLQKEQQQYWFHFWRPRLAHKKYEDVVALYTEHIKAGCHPESHCFSILDRINKRKAEIAIGVKDGR